METINERHCNPIIERVSDSLGVHQPENATKTNGLASWKVYIAYRSRAIHQHAWAKTEDQKITLDEFREILLIGEDMLYINYDKNKSLMEACRPLYEYAWLVAVIRKKQKIMDNLEAAVETAIADMPEDFVIREFLLLNQAEEKGIFLTEYNQEKVLEQERREALQIGRKEGIRVGVDNTNERVAIDMLKDGVPLEKIARCSRLAEEAIINLAQTLGITVM